MGWNKGDPLAWRVASVYPKHLVADAIRASVNDPTVFKSAIQVAEVICCQLETVFDPPLFARVLGPECAALAILFGAAKQARAHTTPESLAMMGAHPRRDRGTAADCDLRHRKTAGVGAHWCLLVGVQNPPLGVQQWRPFFCLSATPFADNHMRSVECFGRSAAARTHQKPPGKARSGESDFCTKRQLEIVCR